MRYALTSKNEICTSANRMARQIHLLHPERTADQCQAEAMTESWAAARCWKPGGNDVRTSIRLRAFRDGRADMTEKPVVIGDLSTLLDFSIL